MNSFLKSKKTNFIIGLILCFSVFFVYYGITNKGGAQTYAEYYNVNGWAWNDSYGWASLNCKNDNDSVDCDSFGINPAVDYGVKISPNKNTYILRSVCCSIAKTPPSRCIRPPTTM